MLFTVVLVILVSAFASGRHFNNPVLQGDNPDPGVIKVDGVYYATATTSDNPDPNKFPIYSSTDLQNWQRVSYILNANNMPPYTDKSKSFWAPEIHKVGNGFRAYFTTRDIPSNRLCIGVASSNNVLGPYVAMDQPLVLDLSQDVLDATLINDNGELYFVWKGSEWMYGRKMNPDGLSFSSNEVFQLMRNDLSWELGIVEGPWFVKRDDMFYMFYSGSHYCGEEYSVGAARSRNPLGPYEKRGDPILVSNNEIKGPGHCSVVRDVDEANYVMVYHGYLPDHVCNGNPRLMMARSVGWGADGWPFMTD